MLITKNNTSALIPKRTLNIYPKNENNIQSLIEYYFRDLELNKEGVVEYLIEENSSLELNQIEFMCRKIKQGYIQIF